jgi:hypothetical protein
MNEIYRQAKRGSKRFPKNKKSEKGVPGRSMPTDLLTPCRVSRNGMEGVLEPRLFLGGQKNWPPDRRVARTFSAESTAQ